MTEDEMKTKICPFGVGGPNCLGSGCVAFTKIKLWKTVREHEDEPSEEYVYVGGTGNRARYCAETTACARLPVRRD